MSFHFVPFHVPFMQKSTQTFINLYYFDNSETKPTISVARFVSGLLALCADFRFVMMFKFSDLVLVNALSCLKVILLS